MWRLSAVGAALLFFPLLLPGCAMPSQGDGNLVILNYNVQNIFDTEVDGSEYEDFRNVSDKVFHHRLDNLSEVIRRTTPAPDIVVLQEVEDEDVTAELLDTYLPEYGYSQVHFSGPGASATQVALLTHLPVTRVVTHAPPVKEYPLRNVLEVEVESSAGPLILLANHWKSRRDGGEELRLATASMVKHRLEAIAEQRPEAQLILVGDFNSEPAAAGGGQGEPILLHRENPEGLAVTERIGEAGTGARLWPLYSPWGVAEEPGSYFYAGQWERIDAFYLSGSLLEPPGLRLAEFRVHPWEELRLGEGRPMRWIEDLGTGYSDHLPLILVLREE
ncbi:MAG: endonuclease/exonuclease/phosphatase family protein [Alkalispirochaetaceae bacterium]